MTASEQRAAGPSEEEQEPTLTPEGDAAPPPRKAAMASTVPPRATPAADRRASLDELAQADLPDEDTGEYWAGLGEEASFDGELEGEATRVNDSGAGTADSAPDLSPPLPSLQVEVGKDAGKEFILLPGETTIGRGVDNDVILTDLAVSRKHLSIFVDDALIRATDLGSGNGTQVNGQRIRTTTLSEGDGIVIGETVLRILVPPERQRFANARQVSDVRVPQPARSGEHPEQPAALPSAPAESLPAPPPTAAVRRSSPSGPHPRALVVPKEWLFALLMIGALLLLLLGATFGILLFRKGDDSIQASHVPAASEGTFRAGIAAYQDRKWDTAENRFMEVLSENPGEVQALRYLQQVREAREHERVIGRARSALRQGEASLAWSLAASVPERSPLHEQAKAVALAARSRQISTLLADASQAIEEERYTDAKKKLDEAQSVDPDNPLIRPLRAKIEQAQGGTRTSARARHPAGDTEDRSKPAERVRRTASSDPTARRSARESTPTSAGDELAVLAAYKAERFSAAASLASQAAERAEGLEARSLERLSSRIQRFEELYRAIQTTRGATPDLARVQQQAVTLDQQISGGHFSPDLKKRLAGTYLSLASTAWTRNDRAEACRRVRQALAVQPADPDGQEMAQRCEKEATQLLESANQLREGNPGRARQLYQTILTLVSPESRAYEIAYERLQAFGRSTAVDEDE